MTVIEVYDYEQIPFVEYLVIFVQTWTLVARVRKRLAMPIFHVHTIWWIVPQNFSTSTSFQFSWGGFSASAIFNEFEHDDYNDGCLIRNASTNISYIQLV